MKTQKISVQALRKETIVLLVLCMFFCSTVVAFATVPKDLTWDGKTSTLKEIGGKLGYDFVDASGNYKPMYYGSAKQLWESGLFWGSNGSFNLDKPITRTEGTVMVLRLLGLEQVAKEENLPCSFTDVQEWAQASVAYANTQGIVNGYSETLFGDGDEMTANQFLTLVLRAMGYRDSEGDFVWDRAAEKAFEIGLIGEPCKEQYMHSNLFLRDNVAVITYNALVQAKMKDGKQLKDIIPIPDPQSGEAPTAVAASISATGLPEDTIKTQNENAENNLKGDPTGDLKDSTLNPEGELINDPSGIIYSIKQEEDYASYGFGRITGYYIDGTLMSGEYHYWVSLTVISGYGEIELMEYVNDAWRTRTIYVEEGETYNITPQGLEWNVEYTLKVSGRTFEKLYAGIVYTKA